MDLWVRMALWGLKGIHSSSTNVFIRHVLFSIHLWGTLGCTCLKHFGVIFTYVVQSLIVAVFVFVFV